MTYCSNSNILFLKFYILVCFLLIFCICFTLFHSNQNIVFGNTYTGIWYLGYGQNVDETHAPADIRIYYTYPDKVFAGQKFNVSITLSYIKNDRAKLNWILFDNVTIALRDEKSYDKDIDSRIIDSSHTIVKPGDSYQRSFNMTAPDKPGYYLIFPNWLAFYGPGTASDKSFIWKMENYYNSSATGVVEPKELPAINVTSNTKTSKEASLVIKIDDPFKFLNKNNITIDNQNYTYSKVENGTKLPINITYGVTLPQIIPLVPNVIRAVFDSWTDGQHSYKRNVLLDHDQEIYALYKTQYHLTVGSTMNGPNTHGTGWYDAGSEAPFSANSSAGFMTFHSFDHWSGEIPKDEITATSGLIPMDYSKEITAIWRPDYPTIAVIIGSLSGALTVLGKFHPHGFVKLIGFIRWLLNYVSLLHFIRLKNMFYSKK